MASGGVGVSAFWFCRAAEAFKEGVKVRTGRGEGQKWWLALDFAQVLVLNHKELLLLLKVLQLNFSVLREFIFGVSSLLYHR